MIKSKNQIALRMEFLELGEKLGYPRVAYAYGKPKIKAGEVAWTAFASGAPMTRLAPAIRNAHILAGSLDRIPNPPVEPPPTSELTLRQKRVLALAKARAAKAKKAQEVTV